MGVLDRKALRDAVRMSAQLGATALVMACGIAVFVGMRATMRSLEQACAEYYAAERFAHVFAGIERAPQSHARRLEAVPGVERIETRVVADVRLDMQGMDEPATGRIVSLPDLGAPLVNGVRLRSGRWPEPGRYSEVLAGEAFAEAHGLKPGAEIDAVIKGRQQRLRVVGIAISPEYTYAIGPGTIFPDNRRFGVLWMRRKGLAAAFEMEGAFNDVAIRVARDASVRDVIHRVDVELAEFGGTGAIARADQSSAFFVANELRQLGTLAFVFPLLFLGVASFLVHMVIGRLLRTQREQIAAMKAFGYRDREVALHYAKLAGLVVAAGVVSGLAFGAALGEHMLGMYAEFFRFPSLPFALGAREALEAAAATSLAAGVGAMSSVRRSAALPPAEALRPEAPPTYRPAVLERLGLDRLVPTTARIVLREIERAPLRAGLTVVGIALATGLTIANAFTFDSMQRLLAVEFGLGRRDDLQIVLTEPRAVSSLADFRRLPGVIHAEPVRAVPVRLHAGHRWRSVTLQGWNAEATLRAVLDNRLVPVELPGEGILLSRKLAEILEAGPGQSVVVEILEGKRTRVEVVVARVVESYVGIAAYMDLGALSRLLGEAPTMNSVLVEFDGERAGDFHARRRLAPVVAGVSSRAEALGSARDLLDRHVGTWMTISLSFSLVMAVGVMYNSVRISLAERARALASLRVLGFRRREVASILFGELAVLTVVALPLGVALGHVLAWMLVHSRGFDTEQFRLPLVISPRTHALAVLTITIAGVVSALAAWRKIGNMDLIAVLKTRD